nr:MAG TPA: Ribulose-phosphate 3-epimerase [Caudoviricetes sp.]
MAGNPPHLILFSKVTARDHHHMTRYHYTLT